VHKLVKQHESSATKNQKRPTVKPVPRRKKQKKKDQSKSDLRASPAGPGPRTPQRIWSEGRRDLENTRAGCWGVGGSNCLKTKIALQIVDQEAATPRTSTFREECTAHKEYETEKDPARGKRSVMSTPNDVAENEKVGEALSFIPGKVETALGQKGIQGHGESHPKISRHCVGAHQRGKGGQRIKVILWNSRSKKKAVNVVGAWSSAKLQAT